MEITQLNGLIDEVEIISETVTRGGFQRDVAGLLVIPGAIGSTGLHDREDMDQAGMISPFVMMALMRFPLCKPI